MKFTIALIATMMLMTTTANADLWSYIKNSKLNPKEANAAYRVETQGLDVRVYEWDPH